MESPKYDLSDSVFHGQTAVGDNVVQNNSGSVLSGPGITPRGALGPELAGPLNDLRDRAGQSPALAPGDRQEIQDAVTGLAGELTRPPAERDRQLLNRLTSRIAALCSAADPLVSLANHIISLIGH